MSKYHMSKKTIEFSMDGHGEKKSKPSSKTASKNSDQKRRTTLLQKIKNYQKHNNIEVKTDGGDFDSDFSDSLNFLDNLSKTRRRGRSQRHNKTLRAPSAEPAYGCLKGGIKPTLRQTINEVPAPVMPAMPVAPAMPVPVMHAPVAQVPAPQIELLEPLPIQVDVKPLVPAPIKKSPIRRRPKTARFNLGKRNKKVSVLIKNRRTRKRVETEERKLVQNGLAQMKTHLIERNLIKSGSSAPNDVIKQMYKDSILAGDVSNNSSETLLHNFMS